MRIIGTRIAAIMLFATGLPVLAGTSEQTLVIQNHRFQPYTITVPADQWVKLVIDNRDATPEEFESHDLRREKVIPGNSQGVVWGSPLPVGEYDFVGEFHEDTARGKLIAK